MKKVLSLMLIIAIVLTMASFPAFAAAQVVAGTIPWNDNYMQANSWNYGTWLDNNEETGDGTYHGWSDSVATAPFVDGEGNPLGNYFELDLGAEYDVESVVIKWGNYNAGWGMTSPIAYSISFAGEDKVYGEVTSYTDLHQKYVDDALPANLVASTNADYKDAALLNIDATETNVGTIRYVKVELASYQWKAYIRDIVVTVDDGAGSEPETPDLSEAIALNGATIRLASASYSAGLRFGATLSKEAVGIEGRTWYPGIERTEIGMYLLPTEMLGENETLADYLENGGTDALKIVAKAAYAQNSETITYTAVLTGIPEDSYDWEVAAVPYILVDGEYTYYEEANKSYAQVAQAAIDSYNNGNPNNITPDQLTSLQEIVDIADSYKDPDPTPDPEEPTPDEPTYTEEKVVLTTDNIVSLNRIWDSGYVNEANFSDTTLFFDGDDTTYASWDQYKDDGATADCCVELVLDLGAVKKLSKIRVSTGADDHFGSDWWSWAAPMNATISVSADGVAYTPVYTYDSDTAESQRVDSVELDYTTDGAGIQFVKYTFNKVARRATIAEIEVYEMVASEGGEGGGNEPGETPDPEEPTPEEPTPDEPEAPVLTEQQVVLTADNIVVERNFVNTGWVGEDSDLTPNKAIFVDGAVGTYAAINVWGNPTDLLDNGDASHYYQITVDLGTAKDLSKVNFHVGAENYGNWWQYAAPLNAEILVAGENGTYTSVYTYNKEEGDDAYRLDAVTLDPATTGADIRYVQYRFSRVYANATIAEIEIFEMAAVETPGPEGPGGDEPEGPGEGGELDIPTGDPVAIVLSADSITAPAGTGDLATLFDSDEATGYLVAYNYSWGGGADPLTSDNEFVIDLGAPYYNPELTLNWGGHGTHGWGWVSPDSYTVYYAGEDGVYTEAVVYTDIYANIDAGTLPADMTASRAYSEECILTVVSNLNANGVRYIKVVANSFRHNGIALNEVSAKGVPNTVSGGGETPDPEEPNPDAPGGETVTTEQKVALTVDNFTFERYFPDSDWRDAANFTNTEFIVDGDYTNYTEWDQYQNDITTLSCYAEVIIDLGAAKNLSKINFHVGAEHFGSDWWSYASPVDPEILVAGEDGVYTSVYSYTGTEAEATRLDSVTLDPATNGAGVRYIKYRFITIVRRPVIAEVEVFEMVETTDEGSEPSSPVVNTYYSIDAAATIQGLNYTNATLPASMFVLPEGYTGFEINGTYKVDADTMRLLAKTPCTGTGTVKYKDYLSYASYIATVDASWGQYDDQGYGPDNYGAQITAAPVSKLSDPVYMSMVLPSDGRTYMDKDNKPSEYKNSGNNMHAPSTDTVFNRLNALGAVYINKTLKSELKSKYSDRQVTVCIGNIRLLVRTADGWISKNMAVPSAGFGMLYALPWQLEWELGSDAYAKQLCVNTDNSLTRYSNYTAIKMNVSDFLENKRGHWWQGSTNFDERVFHFWGDVYYLNQLGISEDTEVLGVISSFEVWIEEEDLAPYFIATSGADWRLESGATRQAFSSLQAAITTEKKLVMGHSFGPEAYDMYVAPDLDYICSILGTK